MKKKPLSKDPSEFLKQVAIYEECDRKLNNVRDELFDAIGEAIDILEDNPEPDTRAECIDIIQFVTKRLNLAITRTNNYLADIQRE